MGVAHVMGYPKQLGRGVNSIRVTWHYKRETKPRDEMNFLDTRVTW